MAFDKKGSKHSTFSSSHSGPRTGSRPGSRSSSPRSDSRSESRTNSPSPSGSFGRDSERAPRTFTRDKPSYDRSPRSFAGKPMNEMTDAVCEKCGKDCKVPFKPQNGKPVYCSDCYNKNDDRPSRSTHFSTPSGDSQSSGSSEELREINRKLDKILRVLDIK